MEAHSGGIEGSKAASDPKTGAKKKFVGVGDKAEDEFYDAVFDQIETIQSQSTSMAAAIDQSTKLAQQQQDMVVETNIRVAGLNERADSWLKDNS